MAPLKEPAELPFAGEAERGRVQISGSVSGKNQVVCVCVCVCVCVSTSGQPLGSAGGGLHEGRRGKVA